MTTCNVVVDLSHNNANVDLQRAQADGIVAVIHKPSQGTAFADPMYAIRRKAAMDAGLLRGAYHFGTGADPVAQAQLFLKVANPTPRDLIVLDFEVNPGNPGNTMNLDQAHAFISTVQDATHVIPGLYGGSYLSVQLEKTPDLTLQGCWLWWAQYGPVPLIPRNWQTWVLWQYTDGHHGNPPFSVDGVGPCDRDQYQGTAGDLQAKWVTGSLA